MERIGIVGMGRMGAAMAARFAVQGRSVTGWTRSALSDARAADLGIAAAGDLADLIAASDVIVTSLFDDAAVAEVLDALLACDLTDRLIVETSTVIPGLVTSRADAVAAAGAQIVDAPIAGGPEMVANGTCAIFVGGDDAASARAMRTLGDLTPKTVHIGPLGTGVTMKCINNSMAQVYFAALAEQMRIAKRGGVPLETALRLLSGGPAGMPMLTARLPRMLGEEMPPGFTVAGVRKDAAVFRAIAEGFDVATPSLMTALDMADTGIAAGLADEDPAVLISHAYHTA